MLNMLKNPGPVTVGEPMTLTLRYTHEGPPLAGGGVLRIGYSLQDGAGTLQHTDPAAADYVTCTAANLVIRDTLRRYRSITHFPGTGQSDLFVVSLAVTGDTVQAGDTIDLVLHAFTPGKFADSPLRFYFHVDPDDRWAPKALHPNAPRYLQFIDAEGATYPDWRAAADSLTLVPRPAHHAELTLPSIARPGATAAMRLVVYDAFGNHLPEVAGEIAMAPADGVHFASRSFSTGAAAHALLPVGFVTEGLREPLTFDLDGLGQATTNPVLVANGGQSPVFWGELHGHSNLSDGGCRGADFFFHYARNIRGLDFAALADHAFGLAVRGHWQALLDAVARHHEDGSFAAILGYEIMTTYDRQPSGLGHRNLYFPGSDGKLILGDYQPGSGGTFPGEALRAYDDIWDRDLPRAPTAADFLAAMGDREFLWTAHHCGAIGSEEADVLALYEACSEWGRSEDGDARNASTTTVQDIFRDGRVNPGLFANSDDHSAKAGARKTASQGVIRHPSGLTAVCSRRHRRQDIYAALRQGHCYGTTGARMLVIPEVTRDRNRLAVKLRVAGTAAVDTVAVFVNGDEAERVRCGEQCRATFAWQASFGEADNCFIRITQIDGETAWINPTHFATAAR